MNTLMVLEYLIRTCILVLAIRNDRYVADTAPSPGVDRFGEQELRPIRKQEMKIAFLIIVALHGLIHMLGFIKGFELKEVSGLTLPISRPMGIVWLAATVLILAYGVVHMLNSGYDWLIGLVAVVVSQTVIVLFWKDAKFGTIPNVVILAVSIVSFGRHSFQKAIQLETFHLLDNNIVTVDTTLKESDLTNLPAPVREWLINSGVLERPFIHCGKVTQVAEMQMKPEQRNWLRATAIQYTTIDDPAFIWSVDVKMNSFVSFQGRDKFNDGKGEMLIKLNSIFNIVDEQGEKMDEASLQRYLGEMVWFPTLALSPHVTWEQIDANKAKATMTYNGTSGSGTFYFNSNAEVSKYSAMRYQGNEKDAKRYYWEMKILDYKTFEGVKVPTKMTATWDLGEKDWTWLKLEVTDIEYNKSARH